MVSSLPEWKREALEERKAQLIEEYKAVQGQLGRSLSDREQLILQRQADDLEQGIKNVEAELGGLSKEPGAKVPAMGESTVQESVAKAATSTIHIDPDNPPFAALRALLAEAFLPDELRRFCLDRSKFRPVVGRFGSGHGLDDIIDELFDYCRTRLLWDELVREVSQVRPNQVTRFAADLSG